MARSVNDLSSTAMISDQDEMVELSGTIGFVKVRLRMLPPNVSTNNSGQSRRLVAMDSDTKEIAGTFGVAKVRMEGEGEQEVLTITQ